MGCNPEIDIEISLTINSEFESNGLNNRGPMLTCKNWLNLEFNLDHWSPISGLGIASLRYRVFNKQWASEVSLHNYHLLVGSCIYSSKKNVNMKFQQNQHKYLECIV